MVEENNIHKKSLPISRQAFEMPKPVRHDECCHPEFISGSMLFNQRVVFLQRLNSTFSTVTIIQLNTRHFFKLQLIFT